MLNEEIYELTTGSKTKFESFGYLYSKIQVNHRFKRLFDPLRFLEQHSFIRQYSDQLDPFPLSVEIDPTNACNHDCPFCIYSSLHQKGRRERISDEKLIEIIRQCIDLDVKSILFIGGGEPMLHKMTSTALQYASENGISTGVVTNGSVFRPDDFDKIRNHAAYIRFSLDAATGDTHQKMHKSNDFYHILSNLKIISAPGRQCTVGVSYFISEYNYKEIHVAAEIAKESGADYIQFKTYSGIENELSLAENILEEIEKTFYLNDGSFDVHVMDRLFDRSVFQVRNYARCHWQNFKTIISADGNLYLCTQRRDKTDSIIGNINEQSLPEIWSGDKRKQVLKQLNLEKCPYCVHHTQNTLIDFIYSQKNTHNNFY